MVCGLCGEVSRPPAAGGRPKKREVGRCGEVQDCWHVAGVFFSPPQKYKIPPNTPTANSINPPNPPLVPPNAPYPRPPLPNFPFPMN